MLNRCTLDATPRGTVMQYAIYRHRRYQDAGENPGYVLNGPGPPRNYGHCLSMAVEAGHAVRKIDLTY